MAVLRSQLRAMSCRLYVVRLIHAVLVKRNPACGSGRHSSFGTPRTAKIAIRLGKSRNAERNLSLPACAADLTKARKTGARSNCVFAGDSPDAPISGNVSRSPARYGPEGSETASRVRDTFVEALYGSKISSEQSFRKVRQKGKRSPLPLVTALDSPQESLHQKGQD